MPQGQYFLPCVIIWVNMYVVVSTPCKEPQIEVNSCKVKLNIDTMSAIAECDVKSNKSSTLAVNISSKGYREKCVVGEFNVVCTLENMQSLEKSYTISAHSKEICKDKLQNIRFVPSQIVQPSPIEWTLKSISSDSCTIELTIPWVAYSFYAPENETWVYNLTYFASDSDKKKDILNMVKDTDTRINLTDLHPYKNYTFLIRWRYAVLKLWSEESEYINATEVGVPDTAPTIPAQNYAHGTNGTAIYLERKSEDIENGPIIAYHVNISSELEKVNHSSSTYSMVFPGNLTTLFLPLNDEQYHSVSIKFASAAGLSPHFTTVYISPHSSPENTKLKRVESDRQDNNFTELFVEDVQDVDGLFIFWCWGIFYIRTNVVNCESNIEFKEINSPREPVLIPSPEHDYGKTCVECSLHYGAAIQINNVTSSILWDSASHPKMGFLDKTVISNIEYYLFIPGVIVIIVVFGAAIRYCRSCEHYNIDKIRPLIDEGTMNLQYTANSPFNSSQFLLPSSNSLEMNDPILPSEHGFSGDSLMTSSAGICSSERTASTDNIRVTPKSSNGSTNCVSSTSSYYPECDLIIIGSNDESV